MERARWTPVVLLVVALSGCQAGADGPDGTSGSQPSAVAVSHAGWTRYLAAAAEAENIEDRVARCLAYPDLPGNLWPAGSAKARCRLLRGSSPTLGDIAEVLSRPGGAAQLDRQYEELLAAHYADPAEREAIFFAYHAFVGDDGRHAAERWQAASPKSGFALAALGMTDVAAAQAARGNDWASDTPSRAFDTMHRRLGQALPRLRAALAAEPRLSPACAFLMHAGRLAADRALWNEASSHCLHVDPLSWNVRFEWQLALDPRWGGSISTLTDSVEAIRPLVKQNPALGSMLARAVGTDAEWRMRSDAPLADYAAGYEDAARLGPDPMYIGEAGRAARKAGDLPKALGYLSQAIRLAPENARFVAARAGTRKSMGDIDGAIVDARRAIELDPESSYARGTLGQLLVSRGRIDEAIAAFEAAMQRPANRLWGYQQLCEVYIVHTHDQARGLDCTEAMVGEYPDDPEAQFQRGWVLYEAGDTRAAAFIARFRRGADRSKPRQREMLAELDRLTATR